MGKILETRMLYFFFFFFQKSRHFLNFFKKQSKQRPKMNNMKIIIKCFICKAIFIRSKVDLTFCLQVVGVICNYLKRKKSKSHFRFNPPTHPWKGQVWPNIFFAVKHWIYVPLERKNGRPWVRNSFLINLQTWGL